MSKYDMLKERLDLIMTDFDQIINVPMRIAQGNRIETIENAIKDVIKIKFKKDIIAKYSKEENSGYIFELFQK